MSRPIRVLLVEDSEFDAALLLLELRERGYEPVCERVETAVAMEKALDHQPWDVVIADYVLPQFSGPDALRLLQKRNLDLPLIIVSGHIDEETAVASMKAGAHDYVMKDRLARLVPAIEREIVEAAGRQARRRSEEQFAHEQRFRHAIEDSIPSGIISMDRDGRHNYVNPAFCEMVGWSEAELLKAEAPFPYWPAEEAASLGATFSKIAGGEAPAGGVELRLRHRSGRYFDALLLANPLHDRQGTLNGWLGSVTDITKRKEAERHLRVQFQERQLAQEALRRAHDELEQRVRDRTADLSTANASLQAAMKERRRLEHELLEITEKERRRIGLDLHDDLGQKLAGLSMMMKGLEVSLRKQSLPEAAEAEQISALISATMEHASGLARDLALVELNQEDLPLALAGLAAHVKKLFNIACHFETEGVIPALDRNTITQFYKIAQEAVTNAVKHGKAGQVAIQLVSEPERLVLTIRNNGRPFPSMIGQNKGMGLRIMNYRASVIGAALEIKPIRPSGTLVTCRLPTVAKDAGNGHGV